ncbi:MAG: sigma-54-dependent Fis family transcriptional regulator, partial [Gammaproteobacteria bacterium]|nr:sigma-54-dependent Fis family transcriptional regulator [Gammaproteobacteria bacterium]
MSKKSDSNKILIINPNPEEATRLSHQLEFIEYEAKTLSSPDLLSSLGDLSEYLAIFVSTFHGIKEWVGKLRADHEKCPALVLLIDDHSSDLTASEIEELFTGSLKKDIKFPELSDVLHRAEMIGKVKPAKAGGTQNPELFRSLVGNSRSIQRVRKMIDQVAPTEASVLLSGESGTGKEVVARNIHALSLRADRPFVAVNCGAIPPELLKKEQFGNEKGAFTGAFQSRPGRFELAEGGTLFLDEIGDMPLNMQVKLLRVIQEKSFERVGGSRTRISNVRLIAA